MPFIRVRDYSVDLMEMNDHLHHLYVESVNGTGGERKIVWIRQHERGLPFTLRENYTDSGFLMPETYARDIRTVEGQLQKIGMLSHQGANICVPIQPVVAELEGIQRLSPKLAGYLKQRMSSLGVLV